MSNPYVVPVSSGYVAAYDTGRDKMRRLPVVAVGVKDAEAVALVINSAGQLVSVHDAGLPGDFVQVQLARQEDR